MRPGDSTPSYPDRSHLALLGLPALSLLFHLLTTGRYGIFRDELYYLANGRHLDFGYVDHPPLIGLVSAALQATLGDSLFAIRCVPALVGALVVGLVVESTRLLGGRRFAQLLAGAATLFTPAYVAQFGYLSMNVFDILFWAVVWWLVARILTGQSERLWALVGVAFGLGLQNKSSVLFLGLGLVVGILLTGRWRLFSGRWPWIGATIALVIFLPHLLWQIELGWPTLEFMENARRDKMVVIPPGPFLVEQIMTMDPLAFPVWFGGLVYFVFAKAARPFRLFGWAYLTILVLLIAQHAKPYYVGPAYTILIAGGGVAWEAWSAKRGRAVLRTALVVLVVGGGVISAPMAKPLLPIETFVRYADALGVRGENAEVHSQGRLPQFFADRLGWRELAQTVATVFAALSPEEREVARVFGRNYGQAGAIDHYGPALGLPPAISNHNSYHLWGPGDWNGDVLLVIGGERENLLRHFESVDLGADYTCADCMPYESEKSIWVARGLRSPVAEFWASIRHYE